MEHPLNQFNFCPKCGSAHFFVANGKAKHCQDCGFTYYFNPSAATVALIFNEQNELLVCRRASEPAKGTLDLPGGFCDLYETAEEGISREVKEETGLQVLETRYLFSFPNQYRYSDFVVHTMDLFFLCRVQTLESCQAMDDAAELRFIPLDEIRPESFGLGSIRKGVERFLSQRTDLFASDDGERWK